MAKADYTPVAQNRTVAQAQNTLQQKIRQMEQQFQLAMPRGIEAVQLVRDALTCLQSNPKLAECEHKSVLGALMTCAQLGLRPGVGVLGQAYLLPFWDKNLERPGGGKGGFRAQLVIGYQGYVELAHRSGRIASIHARTVYSNDYFELEYGAAEDKWIHRPHLDGPRGEPRLFYAIGRTVDGGYSITDPMTVADMKDYRDRHATAKNRDGQVVGPWIDHFEAMAHKTMVRKLMKLLPKSTEQQRAIAHDGGVRVDVTPDAVDQPPDYVDGEVVDEPAINAAENRPEPETPQADEPPPPDDSTQDIPMAGRPEITRLKQIRQAEKYDDDDSWFDYVHAVTGARVTADKDLTKHQAQQVIDLFNQDAAK